MPRMREIIFGLGIFVGLLGACLLVGFGVRYLKPYLQVRTMEEGTCVVIQDLMNQPSQKLVTCQCSRDSKSPCRSQYPCVQLRVNVTATEGDSFLHDVALYDSYETYQLMQKNQLTVCMFCCFWYQPDQLLNNISIYQIYVNIMLSSFKLLINLYCRQSVHTTNVIARKARTSEK